MIKKLKLSNKQGDNVEMKECMGWERKD